MVVCKFFQQGYCRNGQNCRFEHVYGSKYSYHASPGPQTQQPAAQAPTTVTDEMLVKQVQLDIQAVLGGNQWILSCYSPFKEKPCFPGICDLSTEEARLIFYEGQATNNLEKAVVFFNNLVQDARYKYEQLLRPNPAIIKVLRSLYNGEPTSSPFTNNNTQNTTFGGNATSVFRSAMQNASTFNQNTSNVFGQNQNNDFNTQSTAAKSIFSQASQNIFGSNATPNVFGTEPKADVAAKSIFAQASQSIFGQPTPAPVQANPSSIFASAAQSMLAPQTSQTSPFQQTSSPTNVFQQPQGQKMFGTQNVFQQPIVDDVGIYSKMEDLSEDQLLAFQSEEFQMGFIPEIAPPHSLCI